MTSPIAGSFVVHLIVLSAASFSSVNGSLSPNFYDSSCPNLLSIVRDAMRQAVSWDRRLGASILRLFFHDCFVHGCDGSVLLDDTATFTGEKTARPNQNSLRGFEVIDTIKARVEAAFSGVVSCADILALAAREGVVLLGGPSWSVPLGRRDSRTASLSQANSDLPSPLSNLSTLVSSFSTKGLSATDMTALSGGHAIGFARCLTFRGPSTMTPTSTTASPTSSAPTAPPRGGDSNLAPLDPTPNFFDNAYITRTW
ncbi:hypothetical protein SAY86_022800 [Trapa natans]|uniref:peroxidase n=1 Tax=Trapa natans TaxID=22666 RepID=A0AAN7R8Q5_TRANT|nr:hypothetical protein SAY86_022800 [Trapa natans]